MTNDLVLRSGGDMVRTFSELMQFSTLIVRSGLAPAKMTADQAAVVILKGKELGVPMMEALSGINVIQGKATLSPQLMLGLAYRTGQVEDVIFEGDDTFSKITVKRKGRTPHTTTFTIKDAAKIMTQERGETIQLTNKYNWKQMPSIMLQWRNLAKNLRVSFADLGLFYTPEEMGAEVGEEGEIVEGTATIVTESHTEPTKAEAVPNGNGHATTAPAPLNIPPLPDPIRTPSTESNGSKKRATVHTRKWVDVVSNAVAAGYVTDDNSAPYHLLTVVGNAGIEKITDDNVGQATEAIIKHYTAKQVEMEHA